jgi:hypothetical protein
MRKICSGFLIAECMVVVVLCMVVIHSVASMESDKFMSDSGTLVLPKQTVTLYSILIQGGKGIQEDVVYLNDNKSNQIIAAVFDGNGGIGSENIQNDLIKKLIENSVVKKDVKKVFKQDFSI